MQVQTDRPMCSSRTAEAGKDKVGVVPKLWKERVSSAKKSISRQELALWINT